MAWGEKAPDYGGIRHLSRLNDLIRSFFIALVFGLFTARAVPVVFAGQIDIEPSGPYFIEFGVTDTAPEPTFYELFWDGTALFDSSFNFTSLEQVPQSSVWTFSFVQDILSPSYSLDFNQAIEKDPVGLSFDLKPADPNVTITQNGPTSLTISNLIPTSSYFANVAATDPFTGTFTINALVPGAPELDPGSAGLPCLFLCAALLAGRRRLKDAG